MGCFHSKVSHRAISFRKDRCPPGRSIRFPILEDLVNGSMARDDPFVALLLTANSVAMKLKTPEEKEKLSNLLTYAESKLHDTVNAWEMMAGLEDDEEEHEKKESEIEEIHVDDFLSSCSDDDDDNSTDEHGELVAEGCGLSGTSDASRGNDLAAVDVGDVGSDSMRFICSGTVETRIFSEEEAVKISRSQSFRFLEEEESMSGCNTPKFGSYVEAGVSRPSADAAGAGSGISHGELVACLEEAMKQIKDGEEDVLMKIVEDFLEQVHEER